MANNLLKNFSIFRIKGIKSGHREYKVEHSEYISGSYRIFPSILDKRIEEKVDQDIIEEPNNKTVMTN